MSSTAARRVSAAVAGVVLVLAGCTPEPRAPETPAPATATESPATATSPAADGAPTAATPATATVTATVTVTVGELRAGLVPLLREQVLLTAAMTDAALAGDAPAAQAALDALRDGVAPELAAVLAPVYGADVVAPLRQRFAGQADGLLSYASAVAAGDAAAQEQSTGALAAEVGAAAAVMEQITQLPAAVSAPLLQERIDVLQAVVDAQARDDGAADAVELLRDASTAQEPVAAAVAEAVGAQNGLALGKGPASPARREPEDASPQLALGALLLEHAHLAALATGAAVDGREEQLEAALDGLTEGNAADLADVLGATEESQDAETPDLGAAWGATAEGVVAHARARAAGDAAGVEEALAAIGEARAEAAVALAAATGEPAGEVEALLEQRLAAVRGVADLQAAGDDRGAVAALRTAAAQVHEAAAALAATPPA